MNQRSVPELDIEYSPTTNSYTLRPKTTDNVALSSAITLAVADIAGEDVRTVCEDDPLSDYLDLESLDALFEPRDGRDEFDCVLAFRYLGCVVSVRPDETVVISPSHGDNF
ncbi:HalOD1 output domain-containing protein [Halegenticoccus soli]|uniref:HalOD1 output domain-containing protein n=1 Tax=Halegenticoccus soli TaxID=1985678 RepID=UPI000C6CCEA9|nr:HalOD1 output domain-containing protein [Halegenticoccus soli]